MHTPFGMYVYHDDDVCVDNLDKCPWTMRFQTPSLGHSGLYYRPANRPRQSRRDY
jgi:hypothetical protein